MRKLVMVITILLIAVSFVAAEEVGIVEEGSISSTIVTTTIFVEPQAIVDQGKVQWLDSHNFLAYSRGRQGDQVDFVRKGNFDREIFVKNGKMHVRRCGNPVWQIEVEVKQEVTCGQGPQGPQGIPGPPGPSGPPGPQGPPGRSAETSKVVVNNYTFNTAALPSYQLGGYQSAIINSQQLLGICWYQGTRISNVNRSANTNNVSSVNTNNISSANTNVNANNNAIGIGDGSVTGKANGSGESTAVSN